MINKQEYHKVFFSLLASVFVNLKFPPVRINWNMYLFNKESRITIVNIYIKIEELNIGIKFHIEVARAWRYHY